MALPASCHGGWVGLCLRMPQPDPCGGVGEVETSAGTQSKMEKNEECMSRLEVKVHRGENISKGWTEKFTLPNPFLKLNILESPSISPQVTTVKENSKNPEWNEIIHLDLPQMVKNEITLEIKLKHANMMRTKTIAKTTYMLSHLEEGKPSDQTFTFDNGSKVFVTLVLLNRNKQHDETDFKTKLQNGINGNEKLSDMVDSMSLTDCQNGEISEKVSHNGSNGNLETKESTNNIDKDIVETEIKDQNNCENKHKRTASSSSSEIGTGCCNCSECFHSQPSRWWTTVTKVMAQQKRNRSDSTNWDTDDTFDLFQMFKVQHETCYDLEVTVVKGKDISQGKFMDKVDTPDPYLKLRVIQSLANPPMRTTTKTNSTNPEWNEKFNIYLFSNNEKPYTFELTLKDDNGHIKHKFIDRKELLLKFLQEDPLDKPSSESLDIPSSDIEKSPKIFLKEDTLSEYTFEFEGGSKVFVTFKFNKIKNPDLRFSMTLCDEEKNFLYERREKVYEAMKKLLKDEAPESVFQVPTIGILGSGGGFRAMIGLTGALKALQKSGVLDCAMYLAGLSGSSWCISTLYSHENQEKDTKTESKNGKTKETNKEKDTGRTKKEAKGEKTKETNKDKDTSSTRKESKNEKTEETNNDEVDSSSLSNLKEDIDEHSNLLIEDFSIKLRKSVKQRWEWNLLKMGSYIKDLVTKYYKKQQNRPLSWVDIFSHLIGDVLLKEKKSTAKLSDFQKVVSGGGVPFPLCAALHATDRSCKEFSEWLEFSPYEIGLARYGTFMKTETFGSKFLAGKIVKRFDEMPLYTLQGLWGSAFTVNLKRHMLTSDMEEVYGENYDEYADMELSNEVEEEDDTDEEDEIRNNKKEEKLQNGNIDKEKYLSNKLSPPGKTSANASHTDGSKSGNHNWLITLLENLGVNTDELLNTRAVKPGSVYNPFRGLSLKYSFAQKTDVPDSTDASFKEGCIFQPINRDSKKIPVMDSGFALNSPYPLLLRPQRGVKLFLSFDFSPRDDDLTTNEEAFKTLLMAEKWANERFIPFPSIKQQIPQYFDKELQECYVFKNPDDKAVPIIIHFPLVNNQFRKYKLPGVLRDEDDKFGDFNCFDEKKHFSTFKFTYEKEDFDRLSCLMEFNTLLSADIIKKEIKEAVIAKSEETVLGIHEVAKMLLWRHKKKKCVE